MQPTATILTKNIHIRVSFSGTKEADWGGLIDWATASSINQTNDYFIMQVLSDGAHKIVILWGIQQWGTYAAGVYFDGKYPDMASLTYGWYVVRWQDLNGNGVPDYPTEFTIVASGT